LPGLLNQALELEQAARIQYLCHAELVTGCTPNPSSQAQGDSRRRGKA